MSIMFGLGRIRGIINNLRKTVHLFHHDHVVLLSLEVSIGIFFLVVIIHCCDFREMCIIWSLLQWKNTHSIHFKNFQE